jgi:hypothetical protein
MATAPKQKIALNLDTLEREDAKEPFIVVIDGEPMEFKDAADVEWDVLAEMDTPQEFFEVCLDDEQRKRLYDSKLPAWKFRKLWEGYQTHYGLDDRGNARA